MRRMNPREAMRMMKRMGMNVKEVEGVSQVTITTGNRRIIIDRPGVTQLSIQGEIIYQVAGGISKEEVLHRPSPSTPIISDEDVRIVAAQANVGEVDARMALEQSGGDLAKAILTLKGEK